jgi:hypothetical protein
MLAPLQATSQCANLAGNWTASESGSVTLGLTASDGESYTQTDPVSGSGLITITLTGPCTFQYNPVPLNGSALLSSNLTASQLASLVRTITVSGKSITETGVFAILNTAAASQEGLTITGVTGNQETGTGQVNTSSSPYSLTLTATADLVVTGTATNNGQTVSFTLTITASTTTNLVEQQPLQVITKTIPGVASGLAYVTLLSAAGGSGTGYNWCVQSGSTCVSSGSPLPSGFSLTGSGLLSTVGSPPADPKSYPFTVQVTDSSGDTATQALTLAVGCAMKVTTSPREASAQSPTGAAMYAEAYSPSGQTLVAAAKACSFTSFEWQQTIWYMACPSGMLPLAPKDVATQNVCAPSLISDGGDLTALPASPFLDPVEGGDTDNNSKFTPCTDCYPFFDPLATVINAENSPGVWFSTKTGIYLVTADNKLTFYDVPAGGWPDTPAGIIPPAGSYKGLTTTLVGVSDQGSPAALSL